MNGRVSVLNLSKTFFAESFQRLTGNRNAALRNISAFVQKGNQSKNKPHQRKLNRKQLAQARKLEAQKTKIITNAKDSLLIISCARKEFNHYSGNVYGNKPDEAVDLKYLASHGWMHYKSKGDYFTINPHTGMDMIATESDFESLGLDRRIIEYLSSQNIKQPSNIQRETIPEALAMSHIICAAETGCGKTYAYLLPIIHNLLKYKGNTVAEEAMYDQGLTTPHAAIIVPSIELASQIERVASHACENMGLAVLNLSLGSKLNSLIDSLKAKPRKVDLLIATPGSMNIALRSNAISSGLLKHVVIDEADTLLDDSFSRITVNILKRMSFKETGIEGMQLIFASATMPKELKSILRDTVEVSDFAVCKSEKLHHMMGHICQKFFRIDHRDKTAWLTSHLVADKSTPTIVFANACNTASFLSNMLEEKDIPNILLHGKVNNTERAERYNLFINGSCNLLISSDVGSRGMDTSEVQKVINYNMPRYMSDYIHRAGRVGRLNSTNKSGRVFNLVGHRPEVPLVWRIEGAVRSSKELAELPDVDANIKRHIESSLY